MILLFRLLGCSEEPFVFKRKPNQCRQLSSVYKKEEGGVLSEVELEYKWDGNRLDFQARDHNGKIHDNYYVYNEQGFLIESFVEDFNLDQTHTDVEYDCLNEWCWEQKEYSETIFGAMTSTIETEYQWDGRTRKHKTTMGNSSSPFTSEASGYKIFNEYGEPTKEYYKFDQGYREVKSEYDCEGGWCKLQKQDSEYIVRPRNPLFAPARNLKDFRQNISLWLEQEPNLIEDNYEYDWDENKQMWKGLTPEWYRLYNDYGYIIEEYHESPGFKSWTINTYNCKEEQ